MNKSVSSELWKDVKGKGSTKDLRIRCIILLKTISKEKYQQECYNECNSTSWYSCTDSLNFLLCGHRLFLSGPVWISSACTPRSVTNTRSTNKYQSTSCTRIGSIVCKHTTIEDGCVSVCVVFLYCWRFLKWNPFSDSWAR